MQREQFQSNLETELRVWLIDQKPKNLSEAAKLTDQFVAVHKAERPGMKGHEFKLKSSAESSAECRKFGGEVVHVGILALQAKGISCFGWEVRQKLRVLEYL